MSTVSQNWCIPCTSSCLVCGFTCRLRYLCHRFSIGFMSGLSEGVLHQLIPPPIDPALLEKLNCSPGCVFGVIILHQLVSCRINLPKEWQERVPQDSGVELSIHTAVLPLRLIPAHTCTFARCFGLCVYICIRHVACGWGHPHQCTVT